MNNFTNEQLGVLRRALLSHLEFGQNGDLEDAAELLKAINIRLQLPFDCVTIVSGGFPLEVCHH